MPGLTPDARQIINTITYQIRDQYGPGSVLKELIQNADDALAQRFVVVGSRGLPNTSSPLLQAPGLLVANDGSLNRSQLDAMTRASSSDKANDVAKAGRFGLGQKSLFNLCDAFVVQGRISDAGDSLEHRVVNPYVALDRDGERTAATTWEIFGAEDEQALSEAFEAAGFSGAGTAIYIPFRSAALRPSPGNGFSNAEPDLADTITTYRNIDKLAIVTAALRHLRTVEIRDVGGTGVTLRIEPGSRRLSGPSMAGAFANDVRGLIACSSLPGPIPYSGRECQLPDEVGRAFTQDSRWPSTIDEKHQRIPEKAAPHAAAVLTRTPDPTGSSIVIRWGVFLPIESAGNVRIPVDDLSIGRIDILLHGYFFVDSGRRRIGFDGVLGDPDQTFRADWNSMVRREGTLPLLPAAILDAFASLDLSDRQRRTFAKALAGSAWWTSVSQDACRVAALAECLTPTGVLAWQLAIPSSIRSFPRVDTLSVESLSRLFPDFAAWAASRSIVAAFDPAILGPVGSGWIDEEIASLLETVDPRTLQRTETTDHLTTLLEGIGVHRHGRFPVVGATLASLLRRALIGEAALAGAPSVAGIVALMPAALAFALPRSVENRAILRALAQANGSILAVRAAFAPSAEPRSIDTTVAIDWLSALEDLLAAPGEVGDQANAAVVAILTAGPSLADLAGNERARHLRVIRARRVGGDDVELLTLFELTTHADAGRLFTNQPAELLRLLSAAVPDVPLFTIRFGEESSAAGKLRLQTPSSVAAAARILRVASQFGRVAERGALLAELLRHDGVDADVLRALCVGEPISRLEGVELMSLGELPAALFEIAAEAIRLQPLRRVIPQTISDHFSSASRQKLRVRQIAPEDVVLLIAKASRSGHLRDRSGDEAQAILASGLEPKLLSLLPLFRTRGGRLVSIDEPLFREDELAVPASMRQLVAVSDPWPDPVLRKVHDLIPVWTAGKQIEVALAQPDPAAFASEILQALRHMADHDIDPFRVALRRTAWIPAAGGTPVRGDDVLRLDPEVDAELRLAMPGSTFTPFDQLAELVRDHPAAIRLRDAVLLDATESLEALSLLIEDQADLVGCVVDGVASADDLRALANVPGDLGLPAWPLLAALLRSAQDAGGRLAAATILTRPPTPDQLQSHLNALTALVKAGSLGEAARRVHRAAFQRHGRVLVADGQSLPADLLLPSRSGIFRRADALAAIGQGLSGSHELHRAYADIVVAQGAGSSAPQADCPPETAASAIDGPEHARSELAATMRDWLEPWRRAVPSDAIVLLLGLLGRDSAMRALAVEWQSDTRTGSYEHIWNELDSELAAIVGHDDIAAVLHQTIFKANAVVDEVEVRSAAGTRCVVPLAKDHPSLLVGDPIGSRRPVRDKTGRVFHHVDLFLATRPPTSLQADRSLFQSMAAAICPAILLALPSQKAAVAACLARALEIDQVTIEHTVAKLRDQLPTLVRTLVLSDEGAVRAALRVFERISPTDPAAVAAGKDRLWEDLQSPEAADEMLEAVRTKIGQMGYAPSRVLFELLQNADDAYVQNGTEPGCLRLELDQVGDGPPTVMRIIHWGRPINHPGGAADQAAGQGYQNDLYNMLAVNHSEKPVEAGTTGKFGLGFKTVHMVTRNARVASGFVSASIVGGLVPTDWSAGMEAVRAFARNVQTATLIELPVEPESGADAELAIDAFLQCVEWLPAIARRIRAIEVRDRAGDRSFHATIDPPSVGTLAGRLGIVRNGGTRSRKALRLELGGGFTMLVAIGRLGPERILASSSIWNLVPLEEQATSAWIIDGPFDVDPGRSHIKGTPEHQAEAFALLGTRLGERLVNLYDWIEEDRTSFAAAFDLDVAVVASFWTRIAAFFEPDLGLAREARLHRGRRGLGRLWAERPAVGTGLPRPFDRALRASDVTFRTSHALAQPDVFQRVSHWPALVALTDRIVSELVGAKLIQLEAAVPSPLTLTNLVAREIGTGRTVNADVALRLGDVLTLATMEGPDLQPERFWLLAELRTTLFLSAAGTWVDVRNLAMATGAGETESLRAAFAPDANILSDAYGGAALEFFKVARASAGFSPNAFVLRTWAEQATDAAKRTAFLRYLLSDQALAAELAARPISWFPTPLTGLGHDELCAGWTRSEVTLLLALLQQLPPYEPPPVEMPPPEPIDPADFLGAIHTWWLENRDEEIARYDRLTYPDEFDLADLRTDDPAGWFTMFALAIFQNIGRTTEQQGRAFIDGALREGWWGDLAELARTEDIEPWINRLDAWSDPEAGDQVFLSWRRCFVDLYAVAKYLPEYMTLLRSLPAMIETEGPVALQSLMRPYQSSIAQRMDVTAPSIDRSLGMGLNWLIRELARRDFFDDAAKPSVHPYGWTASARGRRLLGQAGIELEAPGRMDDSRFEFAEIVAAIGPDRAIFAGDLDLPLQLISRRDFHHKLVACLVAAGIDPDGLTLSSEDD